MAGPNILEYGDAVEYPTWQWPKNTRLYVENLDTHFPGKVTVHAGIKQEDVVVYGGKTGYIDRDWAGVRIDVYNTGGPTMKVWTA